MRLPLLALHLLCVLADLPATPIFVAGTLNHSCYRVPNAVRAPSGALLVFAEARGPSCDDQAPKDVVLSRSHDDGATWGPPAVVVPGWALGGNLSFRNPYPVFTAGGALLLQVSNSTTPPWFSLQLTSMDEGASWSPPAPLAPSLGPFDGVLNGPGSGLLLAQAPHAGRLLTCGTTVYDTAFPRAKGGVVSVSDSTGAAWSITQVWTASPGGPAVGECQLAELRNGSVLATLRNEQRPRQPCSCRLASRSDDGGAFFAQAAWRAASFSPPPHSEPPAPHGTHGTHGTRAHCKQGSPGPPWRPNPRWWSPCAAPACCRPPPGSSSPTPTRPPRGSTLRCASPWTAAARGRAPCGCTAPCPLGIRPWCPWGTRLLAGWGLCLR